MPVKVSQNSIEKAKKTTKEVTAVSEKPVKPVKRIVKKKTEEVKKVENAEVTEKEEKTVAKPVKKTTVKKSTKKVTVENTGRADRVTQENNEEEILHLPKELKLDGVYPMYEGNDLDVLKKCVSGGENYPIRVALKEDPEEGQNTPYTMCVGLFVSEHGLLTMDITSKGKEKHTTILYNETEIKDRMCNGNIPFAIYIRQNVLEKYNK